jgi:hypothetical protein
MELKDAFIEVWRQVLVEEAQSVKLGAEAFPFGGHANKICGRSISFSNTTKFAAWSKTPKRSRNGCGWRVRANK